MIKHEENILYPLRLYINRNGINTEYATNSQMRKWIINMNEFKWNVKQYKGRGFNIRGYFDPANNV